MAMMKLIYNIPDKLNPFANRHLAVSISKSVSVSKPPHDRLDLLHKFKEFSHTLSAKPLVESVSDVGPLVVPTLALQFLATIFDKEPQQADIPNSGPYIDISDFDL